MKMSFMEKTLSSNWKGAKKGTLFLFLILSEIYNWYSNRYTMVSWCHLRSKFWWFTSSAIHITYRISLRSSSLWEPSYPSFRVVRYVIFFVISSSYIREYVCMIIHTYMLSFDMKKNFFFTFIFFFIYMVLNKVWNFHMLTFVKVIKEKP